MNCYDFNESSKIWRSNKIYLGNGTFKYKTKNISNRCKGKTIHNKQCKKKTTEEYCNIHKNLKS